MPAGIGETTQREMERGYHPLQNPPLPMLFPAIGLIVGIWLSDFIGLLAGDGRMVSFGLPFLFCAGLLIAARDGRRNVIQAMALLAAASVGFHRYQTTLDHPPNHVVHILGKGPVLTRIAGEIISSPYIRPGVKHNEFIPFDPPDRTQFILAVDELRTVDPPQTITGNVRVAIEATELGLQSGQRVELTGKLYLPAGPRNPGERDWRVWYRRQNIDARMLVESEAHVTPLKQTPDALDRSIGYLRSKARGLLLEPHADVEASDADRLIDVLVLGQRSAATRTMNEAFQRAGGMHFLAVSGFHVGVIACFAWCTLRFLLRRGPRVAAFGMLATTLLYAIVAEPNAPILRATILVTIGAVSIMFKRPAAPLNWLSLAVGMLLIDPHALFRPGAQFSFLLVLALITVVAPFHRWLSFAVNKGTPREAMTPQGLILLWLGKRCAELAVTCIGAWLISMPLQIHYFGRFTPWGWLTTFLLTPVIIAVIVFSFITLLTAMLYPPLGNVFTGWLHACCEWTLSTVELAEYLPGSLTTYPPVSPWLVWITYGGSLFLVVLYHRRTRSLKLGPPQLPLDATTPQPKGPYIIHPWKFVIGGVTVLVVLWWGCSFLAPPPNREEGCTVHVLAVGSASATIITTGGGQDAIYDVGTMGNFDVGRTVCAALRALSVRRVDEILISHANFDHYSGLPTVLRDATANRWSSNPYFIPLGSGEGPVPQLLNALPADKRNPTVLRAGDRVELGCATLDILWPPVGLDASWSPNDRSLVIRLTAAGRTVLLPGDIDSRAMLALLELERRGEINLRADVLIAPHHGAYRKNATPEFYAAVSPGTVVVSSREVRKRIEAVAANVLGYCEVITTGEAGAVRVHISPDGTTQINTPYAESR